MQHRRYARCNFDGNPIHPDDKVIVNKFKEWLSLPEDEKRHPRWHKFLGIDCEKNCSHDPYPD